MVLYHPNGSVIQKHEEYLERQARLRSKNSAYTDPIEVVKQRCKGASEFQKDARIHIIVDAQRFLELYYSAHTEMVGEPLSGFVIGQVLQYPARGEGLDKKTLIACSSFAEDYFTYQPHGTELHFPTRYPRSNHGRQVDSQMAYIRGEEIEDYIIPWLRAMERHVPRKGDASETNKYTRSYLSELKADLPRIEVPDDLLKKIHLYNVMLQLGIRSFFQSPLIDALVLQMYQTQLNQCHLDTLEMTVCRFYSRGVPVLDPVLSHLIGTYALRSLNDRQNPTPSPEVRTLSDGLDEDKDERKDNQRYLPKGTNRHWLEYSNGKPAGRTEYPNDTVILPARLEVLGHCIRHWSGVRRNGSRVAAHTGYPLNVGRVQKYYRRRPTSPIRKGVSDKGIHYVDYSTYRLRKTEHYWAHGPGNVIHGGGEDAI